MTSHLEIPTGAINGSNVNFTTSLPYTAGSLFNITDGLMRRPGDDDGVVEDNPLLGTFHTKQTLSTGQALECQFIDTINPPIVSTGEIEAVIRTQTIHGVVTL